MQRVITKCNNKIKIKNTSGTIRARFNFQNENIIFFTGNVQRLS